MRILAVDDEKLICWALKRGVETKLGYSVCCAHTGSEALRKIDENKYDAVITDINLPDFSGMELLKVIRERGMNIPVFIISSHFTDQILESAASYGVCRCISKPFQLEEVILGIKGATETGAAGDIPFPLP